MVTINIIEKLKKVVVQYRKVGLFALLKSIMAIEFSTNYLYEHSAYLMREADFLPRIPNIDFHILETKQQVDELLAKGFELPPDLTVAEKRIAKGAKGFCFFVNRELAHIGWVAMSEEAKSTIDPVPFKIDYANHEACLGGSETIAKYRGQGLMTYCLYERLKYLFNHGILITRNRITKGNIPSEKVHAKFQGRIYAELKYRKILCFESVKESRLQSQIKLGK